MKKIAIVTGNAIGLGQAISARLEELGYEKPQLIRSKDYNLKSLEACQRLVQETIDKYGRLDLLVNNVGNYVEGYMDEISYNDFEEMIDSNFKSAYYMSREALPYLRRNEVKKSRGIDEKQHAITSIINIGYCGLGKLSPPTNVIEYQAAKTALLVLTKGIAKQEMPNGITVNMLSPGSLENTVEDHQEIVKRIPAGRLASLDEACNMVQYFLENDYITGQNIELAGARAL